MVTPGDLVSVSPEAMSYLVPFRRAVVTGGRPRTLTDLQPKVEDRSGIVVGAVATGATRRELACLVLWSHAIGWSFDSYLHVERSWEETIGFAELCHGASEDECDV